MNAKEIESDMKEKVKLCLSDAAYEISFEIEKAYESAIDAFYASYTPRLYDRSYSTYEGSDSHSNYKKHIPETKDMKEIGNIIEATAGIKVSSEYVNAPYKDPIDYVFERTYLRGIHGTIGTGGIMGVPPEKIMSVAFEEIKSNLGFYVNKYMKF